MRFLLAALLLPGCVGPPADPVGPDPVAAAPRSLTGATHVASRRLPLATVTTLLPVGPAVGDDLVLAGTFVGTADLGAPTGPLVSAGFNDIVLARVAPDGTAAWARRFGGAGGDWPVDAALRADGSIVLLAHFQDTADFGTGPLTATGAFDIVLAVYSADGEALQVVQLGDDHDQFGRGLGLAADGGPIVAGRFRFSIDLGLPGGPLTATDGLADIFVAAYTPDLTPRWARRLGGAKVDDLFGLAVHAPSGDVSLAGVSETAIEGRASRGAADAFVVRLDGATGATRWLRGFGGDFVDALGAVAADGEDVVAAGYFAGDADLGAGPMTAADAGDALLARWSPAGELVWVRRLPGFDVPALYTLAVAADGTAWTGGAYREWAEWDGEHTVAVERGDVIVVGAARDGTPRPLITAGSRDEEYAFTLLPRGDELVVTGGLERTLDLGGGPLAGGADDGFTFLARWRP